MKPSFFQLAALLAVLVSVGCGGSASGGPADASTDASMGADAGEDVVGPEAAAMLPPSPDCRFIDDSTTCVDTYILPGTFLYVCGELTESDGFDGGINRPYPPPLPPTFGCRNVAPPVADGGTTQMGALWCCDAPPECVRALAFDSTCAGAVAYSCPSDGVFPAGSSDGGRCTPSALGDGGLVPTPPLAAQEALLCCPAP